MGTTTTPIPLTYGCDAVGISDFINSGTFKKLFTKNMIIQCGVKIFRQGNIGGTDCCTAQVTRDILKAKLPECWKHEWVQNKYNEGVKQVCPVTTLRPGVSLPRLAEQSDPDGELDNMGLHAVPNVPREMQPDLLSKATERSHSNTSRTMELLPFTFGVVFAVVFVFIARRKHSHSSSDSAYKPLVE